MNGDISPKHFLTSTKIIYFGLIVGQVGVIAAFLYMVSSGQSVGREEMSETLLLVIALITISTIFAANKYFNIRLKQIITKDGLEDKLMDYRTILIVKYAILEAPSLISAVFYFITANQLFLIFAFLIFAFYFIYRPTIEKTVKDLNLSDTEKEELYKI